ncbi:hypothetical protein N7495_004107 [Penicillium taxi]|uniref:uncharacterized protein n=1 Tax=Penicillium taxi TaxID=168475 RepID=UPI0025459977|nr:uncharacterized protein N7495_004107 [Penicillium taxi]KAJ5899363.1 hypothetical protein N7495_004107 [Penicillium taxi]
MAAVFIPPSPQTSLNMSTRRPLANVPNATNSPHRSGIIPAKRVRSTQMEIPYGQPPPKKQVMDAAEQDSRASTRGKSTIQQGIESSLFAHRQSKNGVPTAFEKKLWAAREKDRQLQAKSKTEKASAESMDTIRQWQRHYRKAFPSFVFYCDALPEDVHRKLSRQITSLGAREEKFFSRVVTHVVTSRPIPPEIKTTAPTEGDADVANGDAHMQTVNPSLLDKHASLKNGAPRDQGSMDVLQRARQMGMKIWALEKLQRMIFTINDNELSYPNESTSRSKTIGDRDPLASMEMTFFKGPFIYIHDMNEKTKPVMVRDYPRVAKREEGIWPQFRSAQLGKCPFIEEPPSRKDYERERMRQAYKEKKALKNRTVSRTNPVTAATAKVEVKAEETKTTQAAQPPIPAERTVKAPAEENRERKSSESFIPPHYPRTGQFFTGQEPAASGVQASNVTSAIQSQMISSTAATPGARAGLSKEVHGLKRKVLEKGTANFAAGSMAAPQRPAAESMSRPSTGNGLEQKNTSKNDDMIFYAKRGPVVVGTTKQPTKRPRDEQKEGQKKKTERRRDPKPGYCENCRDKFDDFEEHTITRKHRRFAQNLANWYELDTLLYELQRPVKE